MDLNRIVAELRAEKERVDFAINAMELLALDGKKKRGRPKKTMLTVLKQVEKPTIKRKTKKSRRVKKGNTPLFDDSVSQMSAVS